MTTKKALFVLGSLLLVVIISLLLPAKWIGYTPSTGKRAPLILKSTDELAVLQKDTDRNSSPDWKDLLVETTSASTSRIATTYTVTEEATKRLSDPNNMTASFSKNLYTVSSYAKKQGSMTETEQQKIVSNLVTKESEKINVTTYTILDIKTAPTETAATKKAYGNELGKIFKKATGFKLDIIDFDKLQAYSKSNDPNTLSSLVIKKNNAKIIIDDLLKMNVPSSASPYHLLLVNRLSAYVSVLENLTSAKNDPMRATLAFNNYTSVVQTLFSALSNLQLYFKLEEITFNTNEPGYVLDSRYTIK